MAVLSTDDIIGTVNQCLTRLQNSTAAYILDTNPYLSDNDQDAMKAIKAIANEEAAFCPLLERLIEKLEGIPQPGLPDPMLAELNYLSFPWLLDVMIKDKERDLVRQTKRVAQAEGFPEVKSIFEKIRDMHTEHIAKLKDIKARKYKPAEAEAAPAPEASPAPAAEPAHAAAAEGAPEPAPAQAE